MQKLKDHTTDSPAYLTVSREQLEKQHLDLLLNAITLSIDDLLNCEVVIYDRFDLQSKGEDNVSFKFSTIMIAIMNQPIGFDKAAGLVGKPNLCQWAGSA